MRRQAIVQGMASTYQMWRSGSSGSKRSSCKSCSSRSNGSRPSDRFSGSTFHISRGFLRSIAKSLLGSGVPVKAV